MWQRKKFELTKYSLGGSPIPYPLLSSNPPTCVSSHWDMIHDYQGWYLYDAHLSLYNIVHHSALHHEGVLTILLQHSLHTFLVRLHPHTRILTQCIVLEKDWNGELFAAILVFIHIFFHTYFIYNRTFNCSIQKTIFSLFLVKKESRSSAADFKDLKFITWSM